MLALRYHADAANQTQWVHRSHQKVSLDSFERLLLGHIPDNASSIQRGQGMAHCSRLSQLVGPVDSASLQGCKGS